MPTDSLYERCQRVATILLQQNDWALAHADEPFFIEVVARRVGELFPDKVNAPAEIPDNAISRAAKNAYCVRLYEAYRQSGSEEQSRAVAEAKIFVFRRLLRMTDGDEQLADECAHEAASQAWLKWDQVREPGCFLGFVLRIGVREVLARRRKDKRLADMPEGDEDLQNPEFTMSKANAEHPAEVGDMRRRVREAILRCLLREEEARIIIEIFLDGRSYKELATAWGKPAAYLQVHKFRAMEKLMKCKEFLGLRRDWLERE